MNNVDLNNDNVCGLRDEIFNKPNIIDEAFNSFCDTLNCSIEQIKEQREIDLKKTKSEIVITESDVIFDNTIKRSPIKKTPKRLVSKKKLTSKPSILYVDDEKHNLSSFESIFRKDFNVFTALNFSDVKRILKREKINIIISDIKMSIKDGVYILKYVKKYYPTINRFLTSAFSTEIDTNQILNKNIASKVFNKPWSVDDMMSSFSLKTSSI